MLFWCDCAFLAVCGHHLEPAGPVSGVPVGPPEHSQASPERVGHVTDAGRRANRRRQSKRSGSGNDIGRGRSSRDARDATSWVDVDIGETPRHDQQATVHGPVGSMPRCVQVDRQARLGGKTDPFDDVGWRSGRQHQCRLVVEGRIKPTPSLVVASVVGCGPRPHWARCTSGEPGRCCFFTHVQPLSASASIEVPGKLVLLTFPPLSVNPQTVLDGCPGRERQDPVVRSGPGAFPEPARGPGGR